MRLSAELLQSSRDVGHTLVATLAGCIHQLQVIDNDQPHSVLRYEKPGPMLQFTDGESRRVVNIERPVSYPVWSGTDVVPGRLQCKARVAHHAGFREASM